MQIQINTDNHTSAGDFLTQYAESAVQDALGRFAQRVTRVEVHLSDENTKHKTGDNDKRCVLEARLAGLQPIAVTNQAATYELALDGAAEKLEKIVEKTLSRLDDPKGRTSFAGDQ